MVRTVITREDPAGELKALRQRVAELEALINEQQHVDNEPAQYKISETRLINSINDAVNRGSSLKEAIQLVATETQKLFGGSAATIYLLSEDKQYLVMQNFNLPPRIMRLIENLIGTKILTVNIPLKADSIYSEILKAGKAQLTNDPVVVQRMADECTEDGVSRKLIPVIFRFLGVRSVVSIPLVSDGNRIGLMDISRSKPFTESEIERLQTVAGQLVGVIRRKQVEEALKNSEERFRRLADNARDIIFHYRMLPNPGYDYISPAVLRISGYAPQEFYKDPDLLFKIAHPDSRPFLEEITSNPKNYLDKPVVIRWVHKDGRTIWTEQRSVPILSKEGNITAVEGIMRDITERKHAEEQLRESEENLKAYLDNAPDGVCIYDLKGTFLYGNTIAEEILGFKKEELLGKSYLTLNILAPDDLIKAGVLLALNAKGASTGPDEFELVKKDGNLTWVEISTAPIRQKDKVLILSFIRDINDRKRAEEALRLSEENFRNSLNDSPLGVRIVSVDGEGDTLYANQTILNICGYSDLEELRTMPIRKLLTPESYAEFVARREKRQRGEERMPDSYEMNIIRKDGVIRNLHVFRNEVLWDGKRQSQSLYQDITERKRAEEALKGSEENFRNFIDTSPMGVVVFTQQEEILYANQAILDIYGFKNIEELRNTPTRERFTPESYAEYLIRNKKFKSGGTTSLGYELSVIRKDGTIRHLQAFRKEIIWGGEKQFQLLYNDITERKKTEEALKGSEDLYSTLANSSPVGVYTVQDRKFNYTNVAFQKATEFTKEELLCKTPLSLVHPEDRDSVIKNAIEMVKGKRFQPYEFRFITKSGEIRWALERMTPITYQGRRASLGNFNDITEQKHIQEALRISEENYRNSVANSPMGIIVFKQEGDIIYANQTLLDMYGFSNIEELRNTPVKERYTPEAYAEYLVRHEEFLNGKTGPIDYEMSIRRKDGAVRQLQAFRRQVVWGGEEQFQLLYIDITERKRAEDSMRESRARFRELARLLPLSVWETDENGMVTYTNEATMRLYGYTRQDTVPISYIQNMIPEDRDRAAKNTQRLLQGETLGGIEYTGLRKDGSTFPVMVYGSAIFKNGKGVGLRGITIDITEQKIAEKRLEQAAQEWRTTFDSIIDSISIHDKDNRIIRVNKAEADMLKTTPKEIIGKFCHELVHNTAEPPENCPHRQTLKTGNPASIESYNPELGIYLYESTSPIFDDKGEVVGTVHIVRDVTKQKQMEQQLMLTDRLASVGELASGVAHELNNPLTSVIGFSQLLMEGEIPTAIKEDLGLINSEAQRAASIVKNLLTFARKHAAVKQPTKINNLIEDVLKLRAYEQKVNNIEVIKNLASDIPEIMLDYFQIQQVFLNIIINAEFFMTEAHRRGLLTITTEKIGRMVRVSFADDGPGIPQENLNRIFDPFFTTKEVGKGTGLGLSICHGIITEHSGTIHAESPGGKGAAFIIELPLSEIDACGV